MVCVILVAEDEMMIRNIVRHMMESEGHEVLTAADGAEALELSRNYTGTIDLLITDVVMPRLDGLSLIQRILEERPNLRILVMSGRPSPELGLRSIGVSAGTQAVSACCISREGAGGIESPGACRRRIARRQVSTTFSLHLECAIRQRVC